MRKLLLILVAAGVLFGLAVASHGALQAAATGDGAWADRARASCASCHG